MNPYELCFCEEFERRLQEKQLLSIISGNLTAKGRKELRGIEAWLDKHRDEYMEITSKRH